MLAGIVSPTTPFIGEQPNKNISLCVYADETGLRYWNKSSDPMPIKTINMAGLQKWEETDDYIIYLDKDAVMTTVESYVTGTYDLFLERKADIDGSMELLKINDIEWTSEDDSKLILDINKAQLERIANTPTTMEEEDFAPQTFTTRAVPTTYECCFRIDKSSGEIYIGEGYENIWSNSSFETSETVRVSVDIENNRVKLTQITKTSNPKPFVKSVMPSGKLAFVTGATSEGYSCVIKNIKNATVLEGGLHFRCVGFKKGHFYSTPPNNDINSSFVGSSKYFNLISDADGAVVGTSTHRNSSSREYLTITDYPNRVEVFKQLLIYKANFTEAELKAENEKDIRLNDGYNEYFNIRRDI